MTDTNPAPLHLGLQLTINIRPAIRSDIPKLEMDGQFLRFRRIFHRAFREMERGERLLLVATCNQQPVGRLFVLFKSSDSKIADGRRRAYLYSFYVLPPFRGMGLGTRMVQYAEEVLIARGFEYVTIAVAKDNPGARRLYERLDYQVKRDDPGRWSYLDHEGKTHRMNEPCWIMEKKFISC